jgi:transcription initiation factor TFIID TATA-box-binding protein
MISQSIAASALRERLNAVDADLNADDATGYVTLDTALNLNALAIGLGLENIEYEPEQFPGLLYHLDDPRVTVVLFGNGVITTVDGKSNQAVQDAIRTAIDRGTELGLLDIDSMPSVNTDVDTIPVPEEFDTEE